MSPIGDYSLEVLREEARSRLLANPVPAVVIYFMGGSVYEHFVAIGTRLRAIRSYCIAYENIRFILNHILVSTVFIGH